MRFNQDLEPPPVAGPAVELDVGLCLLIATGYSASSVCGTICISGLNLREPVTRNIHADRSPVRTVRD